MAPSWWEKAYFWKPELDSTFLFWQTAPICKKYSHLKRSNLHLELPETKGLSKLILCTNSNWIMNTGIFFPFLAKVKLSSSAKILSYAKLVRFQDQAWVKSWLKQTKNKPQIKSGRRRQGSMLVYNTKQKTKWEHLYGGMCTWTCCTKITRINTWIKPSCWIIQLHSCQGSTWVDTFKETLGLS